MAEYSVSFFTDYSNDFRGASSFVGYPVGFIAAAAYSYFIFSRLVMFFFYSPPCVRKLFDY